MYLPKHFKETNPEHIAALVQSYPFGALVTAPDGMPFVSHLPLLFDSTAGAHGKLLGHMARANPQWQHLAASGKALAVFQGPHAYVSPSWYASPGVPTWNYAVVHLYGKARLIEDEAKLEGLITRLTHIYESPVPSPWKPDFSGERHAKLLGMIVGFEIEITDVQGKFKLSQNRPAEDQRRVIEALSQSSDPLATSVAKLMTEMSDT
ncbi:MAG: FMN-binding negative transcriptional regulator [Gammaproteobacteria bacterium]|nr:FMN-binding negative transcriptional regulator [Gammaproteobacteria bacterium]